MSRGLICQCNRNLNFHPRSGVSRDRQAKGPSALVSSYCKRPLQTVSSVKKNMSFKSHSFQCYASSCSLQELGCMRTASEMWRTRNHPMTRFTLNEQQSDGTSLREHTGANSLSRSSSFIIGWRRRRRRFSQFAGFYLDVPCARAVSGMSRS